MHVLISLAQAHQILMQSYNQLEQFFGN